MRVCFHLWVFLPFAWLERWGGGAVGVSCPVSNRVEPELCHAMGLLVSADRRRQNNREGETRRKETARAGAADVMEGGGRQILNFRLLPKS